MDGFPEGASQSMYACYIDTLTGAVERLTYYNPETG
jgi:hypothetical protein